MTNLERRFMPQKKEENWNEKKVKYVFKIQKVLECNVFPERRKNKPLP